MNFTQHRADMLRHYTTLVTKPHWRQYVQHQVKTMAADCPALYRTLPAAVEAALAAHRAQPPALSKPTETPSHLKPGP